MTSLIRDRAAGTSAMLAVFDDDALLAAALRFEAALALASAAEALFPAEVGARIAAACATPPATPSQLAEDTAWAGTLAIPLVRRLRERLHADPDAARWLHHGATSQDLADTAFVLQAKAGAVLIERETERLAVGLHRLARAHAATAMLGRTLLQPALPITFGLKAAQWLLSVDDALARFRRERAAALRVQLGGGAGSRVGLDDRGGAIAVRMAEALGLAPAAAPWHTRRGDVAGLGAALAILVGAVGTVARDVALLAQGEVGEAREPVAGGRGGSSAMPHKRNPTGCQVALSAAVRAPHLAATLLSALPQEHERGLGGWQAEAPALVDLFVIAHGALAAMAPVIEGLEVDTAAMARNLAAADVGQDTGESAAIVDAVLSAREGAG